jgi:Flp pilus assembly protein TadB
VSDVPEANDIEAQLRQAASLPEILAAGFDAFEAIRMTARDCQDQVPALFATFMTTADAAVDGREALTIAPSLPLDGGTGPGVAVPTGADAGQAADALAALAAVLHERLTDAATRADLPGDRTACQDAAEAGGRICQLMTR